MQVFQDESVQSTQKLLKTYENFPMMLLKARRSFPIFVKIFSINFLKFNLNTVKWKFIIDFAATSHIVSIIKWNNKKL